jgi:hypothetical protein
VPPRGRRERRTLDYNTGLVSTPVSGPSDAAGPRGALAPVTPIALAIALALIVSVLAFAALSVDVVRAGFGIKGDEATYVSMALSVAHDRDLAWDRGDLDRFWRLYRSGPEGIFLKRGQQLRIRSRASFPYLRLDRQPDLKPERLYFGKAFAYGVAAAPFVRLAGLNGLLLFHVLLWGLCVWAGYVFLRARSPAGPAFVFSLAFFGVSIAPVYLVWLTPEVFHLALVFLAGFLWFYREVAPPAAGPWGRLIRGRAALYAGAVLLGVATFSKPPNLLLVGPPVLVLWQRRRLPDGLGVGLTAAATIAALFAVNAAISGDVNYQGGDRKTFYGTFPFERPEATYDTTGIAMSTNELGADEIRAAEGLLPQLARNAGYFVAGRHAGFVAYFFPAAVLLAVWLRRWRDWQIWHWAIAGAVAGSVLALLVALPYSWAGGGGPPGNRYFLSLYPALFFLSPAWSSWRGPLVAWMGGAAFLGHILVNPFVSAKYPWQGPQRGLLRLLPVELTMVNDLPVMLDSHRARVPYGRDPVLLLYFLDDHTYAPEPEGIWVAAGARTQIIVRTGEPLDRFTLTLRTIVPNRVRVRAGAAAREAALEPGAVTTLGVPARGVASRGTYAYLLEVTARTGAVPALVDPASRDGRPLGVLVQIQGHLAGDHLASSVGHGTPPPPRRARAAQWAWRAASVPVVPERPPGPDRALAASRSGRPKVRDPRDGPASAAPEASGRVAAGVCAAVRARPASALGAPSGRSETARPLVGTAVAPLAPRRAPARGASRLLSL